MKFSTIGLWYGINELEMLSFFYFVESRFSFVISGNGEVTQVFHAAGEDAEVISTKKGFAGLFASRLHDKNEVDILQSWI